MATLISNGKTRLASSEVVVGVDQVLSLTLTTSVDTLTRSIVVQRKNSKNEFKNFSLNDGIFCILDKNSPTLQINVPGTYRVIRPDLTAYDAPDVSVGVSYTVSDALAADDPDQDLSVTRSAKDGNGVFTTLEFRRDDATLAKTSVLSGGTSPAYTTRTETWYAANGTTVTSTKVYTLAYDGDGDLESETLN